MSLAKRQVVLATFIDTELSSISFNQKKALEAVGDRNKSNVGLNQQMVMTSYNNLALLLNEVLQQMQSQMQSQMVLVSESRNGRILQFLACANISRLQLFPGHSTHCWASHDR